MLSHMRQYLLLLSRGKICERKDGNLAVWELYFVHYGVVDGEPDLQLLQLLSVACLPRTHASSSINMLC